MPLTRLWSSLVVMIPWLWLLGVYVVDLSRVLALIIFVFIVVRRKFLVGHLSFKRSTETALGLWLIAYCIVLFVHHQSGISLGRHGVDFSIFLQVVHNIGATDVPTSTLIGPRPQNFLTHHFVPILFIPGWMAKMGLDAATALIFFHAASFAAMLLFGFYFAKQATKSNVYAVILTAALAWNPTIRQTIFFEVHDEVFALPWIALAWVSWRQQKWNLMMIALLLVSLTKESMFAVVAAFGVMTYIDSVKYNKNTPVLYSVLSVLYGVFGFVGYTWLQPMILNKSFDHMDKLASLSDLLQPRILAEKAVYVFYLFVPYLFIPLWKRRYWHLLLPILPLLGIVMVSGFSEMWKIGNYYGAVPSLILGLIGIDILKNEKWVTEPHPRLPFFIFMVSLCFSFGGSRPLKLIMEAVKKEPLPVSELNWISSQDKVLASPSVIPFLLNNPQLRRVNSPGIDGASFDVIIVHKDEGHLISEDLKQRSVPCHTEVSWLVRCRSVFKDD